MRWRKARSALGSGPTGELHSQEELYSLSSPSGPSFLSSPSSSFPLGAIFHGKRRKVLREEMKSGERGEVEGRKVVIEEEGATKFPHPLFPIFCSSSAKETYQEV